MQSTSIVAGISKEEGEIGCSWLVFAGFQLNACSQAGKKETRKAARPSSQRLSLGVRVFALESPARLFRVQMLDLACK